MARFIEFTDPKESTRKISINAEQVLFYAPWKDQTVIYFAVNIGNGVFQQIVAENYKAVKSKLSKK